MPQQLTYARLPPSVVTIPIGYGDGYPRHVSGHGAEVWLRGRRFPILGRVTMDQIMLDVTGADDVAEGGQVAAEDVELVHAPHRVDQVLLLEQLEEQRAVLRIAAEGGVDAGL